MTREIRKELLLSLLARSAQRFRVQASGINARDERAGNDYIVTIRRARTAEKLLQRTRFDGQDYHFIDNNTEDLLIQAGFNL